MALRPVPRDTPWTDEIVEGARGELWATIDIIDPSTETPGTFDPETDGITGATPAARMITGRAARVQLVRSSFDAAGSFEWNTKQNAIVEYEGQAGDPDITKGMVVRLTASRQPTSLLGLAFVVDGPGESDHVAFRVLKVVAEFGQSPNA